MYIVDGISRLKKNKKIGDRKTSKVSLLYANHWKKFQWVNFQAFGS